MRERNDGGLVSAVRLSRVDKTKTLVESVMAALCQRIVERGLLKGARLPSIRRFAEELGVSKSTVVDAYDRLGADGLIESRRGAPNPWRPA